MLCVAMSTILLWGCHDRFPAEPGPSGQSSEMNGKLVFNEVHDEGGGNYEAESVVAIDVDGTNREEIGKGLMAGSPGLNRIAFERNDTVLVATRENGRWTTRVIYACSKQMDEDLAWGSTVLSPDGRIITFSTRFHQNLQRTYLANADGTGTPAILPIHIDGGATPVFSRDSRKLAYYSDGALVQGFVSLHVVNTDGSGQVKIGDFKLNPIDLYTGLDFSPDGSSIVFEANDPDDNSILIARTDGSDTPRKLVSPAAMPIWNGDGTKIIYVGMEGTSTETDVMMMNADGSGTRQNLTRTPGRIELYPQLSPDGKKVLYSAYTGEVEHRPAILEVRDIANPANVATASNSAYKAFWAR